MAVPDRLTVPFTCPACSQDIAIPTKARYERGKAVFAFDTAALREHVQQHIAGHEMLAMLRGERELPE